MNKQIVYIYLLSVLISVSCSSQTKIERNGILLDMPTEYELTIDSSYNHKTTYIYKSILDEITYQLNVSEYFNNMYHSDSLKNIEFDLDYSQKSSKEFQEGTLFDVRHKSINGYPGKEYRLRNSYNSSINLRRVYIIKNNVVELTFSGPETKLYLKETTKFLNSLQLINIDKNIPPYLNIPSTEELKIRPYESNVKFSTEQRVEVLEYEDKKIIVVGSVEEFNPMFNDGLNAIGVMYVDFSKSLTDQERNDYINNYIKGQSSKYNNFTLLEESNQKDWKFFKFQYQLGEKKIFEERRLKFDNNRLYQLNGIYSNINIIPKKLSSFYQTFEIK